ncbi:hypothetical protein [Pseudobutyrivibrio sp. 49]|uniref:hypothetical protein n=1 Tax=Pseudobutyrivibrio sp. 49 TaxID=1855344 RepID=UPI00115FAB85|nr:hypothetical protein [Pseudobutyrivibrio sp. 49]
MMCLNTIACGADKDSTVTSSEETNSPTNAEFFEHFDGKLSSVEYFEFNERKTVFTNEQALSIIQDTLNSCTYEEIDSNDYKKGFYSINLVFEDRTEPLGIAISTIAVGGKQYKTIDGDLSAIISIINSGSMNYISSYFIDSHEHESMKDGYTVKCDLNTDGKNEKIVVEQLECNGGDGGYFPHVYSSDGEELIYQEDKYATPFDIDWNEGAATISYNDEVLVDFTKENVKEIYYKLGSSEYYDISNIEGTVMSAYDSKSDCASGFVVTDNGELLVKYYISGAYGHSDTFGYGVLHLTLDKENKWTIKPEFVLDSDPHKEVALDDSLEESTDEYIVSSTSPVETLPYDPEAEWNYVPLD